MVTTAATIIIDKKTNRILLCHVTEHDFWSLPKGVQEDGELLISTALREVEEETGLVFDDDGVAASAITYHDTYSYIKNKNMAVFSIQVHEIDLSKLKCASTFVSDIDRKTKPEVDDYLLVDGTMLLFMVNEAQKKVLKPILEELCLIES